MQRPGCAHLIARQMEEEGGIQHEEPKNHTQSRTKKSPFILKGQRAKNNQPDLPWKQNRTKTKENRGKNNSNVYWNQHYRLHVKHAQENVQWELLLYMECVSSALQHFCPTQRVLTCPGWDSDVTHQNRLFPLVSTQCLFSLSSKDMSCYFAVISGLVKVSPWICRLEVHWRKAILF